MRAVLVLVVAVVVGCSHAPSAAYQAGAAARGTGDCIDLSARYTGSAPPVWSRDRDRWNKSATDFIEGCRG